MKLRSGHAVVASAALWVWACESDLSRELSGRACRDTEPRCLPGFVCNDEGACVDPDSLQFRGMVPVADAGEDSAPDASMDGSSGSAGNAGSAGVEEPVDAGSSGGSGSAGGGGSSGTGGSAGGGGSSGGEEPVDGGVDAGSELDAGPSPDACTPVTLYEDLDGDTFGNPDVTQFACPRPGWVTTAGDCRDGIFDVHPQQDLFFGVGFSDSNKPNGVSFDYDCSGAEQSDPDNALTDPAPTCPAIALVCPGSGYAATSRTGTGILDRCGSTTAVTCNLNGLGCTSSTELDLTPFRCK